MEERLHIIPEQLILDTIAYMQAQPVMPPATLLVAQTLIHSLSTLELNTENEELKTLKESVASLSETLEKAAEVIDKD